MKTLEPPIDIKDKVEIIDQQKQEYKLVGSIILRRGMKIYSYRPDIGKIEEVNIKRESVTVNDKMRVSGNKSSAIFDQKAIYITAINMKNAQRKANKIVMELIRSQKP